MEVVVLYSGGDAPGMNACVRAVVRSATTHESRVVGIRDGYQGRHFKDLDANENGDTLMAERFVAHAMQSGRMLLRIPRCE